MTYILGIDESGVGALAGPLVVGAALVPDTLDFGPVGDPKTMTPRARQKAFARLLATDVLWATTWDDPATVDAKGIWNCWSNCVRRAIRSVLLRGVLADTQIIVDGSRLMLADDQRALGRQINSRISYQTKADTKILAVKLASLAAKISHDRCMRMHGLLLHRDYELEKNVGYGSEEHLVALVERGATPIHRKSFRRVR